MLKREEKEHKITILLISTNKHKVEEINNITARYGVIVVPANIRKMEIQSDNLVEIALMAARSAYSSLRKPLIVEDAGLFIKELNGFPGPYSSYVYRTIGCKGILKLLEGIKRRDAYFKSVIVYKDESYEMVFEGLTEGEIAYDIRGSGGFGFDPIFIPKGYNKTFAEMSLEEKNRLSHRGKAVKKFIEWFIENRKHAFK